MERLAGICVSEDCVNSVLIRSAVKKDSIWIALQMLVYLYKKQLMIPDFSNKGSNFALFRTSSKAYRRLFSPSKAGMCFRTCSGVALGARPDQTCFAEFCRKYVARAHGSPQNSLFTFTPGTRKRKLGVYGATYIICI